MKKHAMRKAKECIKATGTNKSPVAFINCLINNVCKQDCNMQMAVLDDDIADSSAWEHSYWNNKKKCREYPNRVGADADYEEKKHS